MIIYLKTIKFDLLLFFLIVIHVTRMQFDMVDTFDKTTYLLQLIIINVQKYVLIFFFLFNYNLDPNFPNQKKLRNSVKCILLVYLTLP